MQEPSLGLIYLIAIHRPRYDPRSEAYRSFADAIRCPNKDGAPPAERTQHDSRLHQPLTSLNDPRGQIIGLASNSALRTFTLRRDPLSSQWLLESITDGY